MRKIFLIMLVFFHFQATFARTDSPVKKETVRYSSYVLPDTEIRQITSKINNINYKIYVSLPAGFHKNPQRKFQGVFLLDADYSFPLAKQVIEHLSDRNKLRESVIIGIAYDGPLKYRENRTRDYTPTFVPDGGYGPEFQKYSGGAPLFAKFLSEELIPYAIKEFQIDKKAIVGHSFGGLFVSWMFLNHNNVFDQYISVSPSLWYDNELLLKSEIPSGLNPNKKIFLGIGEKEDLGNYKMVTHLKIFQSHLANAHLDVKMKIFSDEDHDTVFPSAVTRGLVELIQ